jgi:CubicO group peptidase (beta-lactamase class C family)
MLTFLIACASIQAAAAPKAELLPAEAMPAAVQSVLDAAQARDADAELRVWIAYEGKVLTSCAAGTPAGRATEFVALGALSHSFTAVLALQMAEAGALSLEKPLREQWPELPWSDTAPQLGATTLAAAMAGVASLPRSDEMLRASAAAGTDAAWLRAFTPDAPLGTRHDADDAGWALVARACEWAGKANHHDLIRERLLAPLELVGVRAATTAEAVGAVELLERPPKQSSVELAASPEALACWMKALLERRLLQEPSTRRYMTPSSLLDGNSTHCGYGLAQSKVMGLKRYRMTSERGVRQVDLSYWSLSKAVVIVEAVRWDEPVETLSRPLGLAVQNMRQADLTPATYEHATAKTYAGQWMQAGRLIELQADETQLVQVAAGRRTVLVPLANGVFGCTSDPEARWSLREGTLILLRGGYETKATRVP